LAKPAADETHATTRRCGSVFYAGECTNDFLETEIFMAQMANPDIVFCIQYQKKSSRAIRFCSYCASISSTAAQSSCFPPAKYAASCHRCRKQCACHPD